MRSDLELLDGWRAGDAAAGEELVTRHWASVSRFVRSKVGDDGADLISQTFLACVEARDRIDNVKAFLFGTARRRLADHFRRTSRHADPLETSVVDLATGPVTQLDRLQRADLLRDALTRIPLDDQIALELAYFEALPNEDIARILEINENTVRSRLSRARQKLRDVLARLAPPDVADMAESQLGDPIR